MGSSRQGRIGMRWVAVVAAIVSALVGAAGVALAAGGTPSGGSGVIASGTWGTCPWEIRDGVLTIYPGTGADVKAENEYGWNDSAPWSRWEDDITAISVVERNGQKVIAPEHCYSLFSHFTFMTDADLSGFDTSHVKDMSLVLAYCDQLATLDISGWDTSRVENMSSVFSGCSALTSISLSEWDTSQVTDMSYMFDGCSSITALDLSGWDTSRVTSMDGMFADCNSLATLDVTSWDTSQVEGMVSMYSGCALDEFRVGAGYQAVDYDGIPESFAPDQMWWSTTDGAWYDRWEMARNRGSIADAYRARESSTSAGWDLSDAHVDVVGQRYTGKPAEPPVSVTLRGKALVLGRDFDVSYANNVNPGEASVTAAGKGSYAGTATASFAIFPEGIIAMGEWGTCSWEIEDGGMLTIHPGVGVDTEYDGSVGFVRHIAPWWPWVNEVTSVKAVAEGGKRIVAPACCEDLFLDMSNMVEADLSGMDTSQVSDMSGVFSGCSSLASLDVSGWDTSRVTSMSSMFSGCSSLASLDVSHWDTLRVEYMDGMFIRCSSLASLDVSRWDTSRVRNMSYMFRNCPSLTYLDVSSWNTSRVTGMHSMFWGCTSLATLDVSRWDTSQVTDMGSMFPDCSSLATLDVSGWDTSRVTEMGAMFSGCSSLATLDVSGWDTSRVEGRNSMYAVFADCSSLLAIDVSGWDTSGAEELDNMFFGCASLKSLDLAGWDTSRATHMGGMFSGCSSLTSLDLSGWDTSQVKYMGGMFNGCSSLVALDLFDWDTSRVTDVHSMFNGCSSLASLDVSGWDTSNVGHGTDSPNPGSMGQMYDGCHFDEFRVGSRYVALGVDGVPSSRIDDGRWWSESDGAWYTREEVAARAGVADTYLSAPDEAPSLARDGWVDLSRGGKGYVRNGALVKGWFDLGSSKYWFHPSGRMATGWTDVVVSGNTMHYYFNPTSGNLVRGTWFDIGGTKYYFRPSGNMATGWATISDNGVDKKYYFDSRGRMLTGWQDIDTGQGYVGRYYLRPSGAMATGWAAIDGEKYWFRPSGNMATGFADVDDAYKRYFEESGRMTTGWRRIGSSVYYFRPSGAMQTGQATIDGVTYTFSAKGVLVGEPPEFHQKPDYASDMALGRTPASAGEGELWHGWFVAPSAGTYVFYSEGDYDTYGTLYAEDGETYLDYNDDGGNNTNFRIERELAAGEAVVLEVRDYYGGSFECDVLVEAGAASMLASRPSNASPVLVLGDGAEGDGGRDELPLALDGASPLGSGSDAAGSGADEPADLSEVLADGADAGLVDALPSDTPGEVVELGG